jgi:probable phosphoglycerate mutase
MSSLPGTTGRRRVYLMRHGHVNYFSAHMQAGGAMSSPPLTRLGRDQADAAGAALADVAFDVTISSGYLRTMQTLDRVMAKNRHGRPEHEHDTDIVELKNGRPLQVKSRRDIATAMAFHFDAAAEPGATMMEGGEVFTDALARAERMFLRLLARPGWHTALVVAHEGINRVVMSWMTGSGLKAVQAFDQDLACVNVLDFDLVPAASGQGTEIARRIIRAVNMTPYNYVKYGMNLTSLEFIFEPYEERPDEEDMG